MLYHTNQPQNNDFFLKPRNFFQRKSHFTYKIQRQSTICPAFTASLNTLAHRISLNTQPTMQYISGKTSIILWTSQSQPFKRLLRCHATLLLMVKVIAELRPFILEGNHIESTQQTLQCPHTFLRPQLALPYFHCMPSERT